MKQLVSLNAVPNSILISYFEEKYKPKYITLFDLLQWYFDLGKITLLYNLWIRVICDHFHLNT